MRRWFLIFLVAFLPMQLTWAAVASYCQHEIGVGTKHLGHHLQQHRAHTEPTDTGRSNAGTAVDTDCGICHTGCVTAFFEPLALLSVAAFLVTGTTHLVLISSPPPSLPERPNWANFA